MKTIVKLIGILVVLLVMIGCGGGYTELFDGKSLDGWECDPADLLTHWK